jgi:NodT family efflux transporter outer membrane factor (OMF) lipoprotein
MTTKNQIGVLCCALSALAGCTVGPDYQRAEVAVPAAYKEAPGWKTAAPRDEATRGAWWECYGDPELNALVAQVALGNENVKAAQALVRQAQAVLGATRAGYFPTVSGSLAASRAQSASSDASPSDTRQLSLSASWEADVWGRIGRAAESDAASVQASAADLQAALLSAQATLVQSYLQLRVDDAQRRLLEATSAAYERSLQVTRNRYAAGVAGRVDVAQAEMQLKATQAQAIDVGVERSQLEHAIAALIGKPPADFSLPSKEILPTLPEVPASLPSALLERRPDVAAAERRTAAANAQIGVAQAAFFPALTLSASGGYQNSSLSDLISVPNRFWSLGPALALTLFDAGARSAQKAQAIAVYDQNVATYRQTVLTAFQEVEDNLAALRILAEEAVVQSAALDSASESLRLTNNQYRAGTVNYLNVVVVQAAALTSERTNLEISGRRLLASAALFKALGGGWQASALADR